MEDSLAIKEMFDIVGHVASTRTADLYRAESKGSGEAALLWTLRYPLRQGQAALGRLSSIAELKLTEIPLLETGIDSDGILYAVLKPIAVQAIKGKIDVKEAERRFIPCLKLISKLHAVDIRCGDLSSASFCCDRNSLVFFIGVMGTHDGFASGTAVLPPFETLQYMAPEQRTGSEVSKRADVFALGVLGYELLIGKPPWSDEQLSQSKFGIPTLPSKQKNDVPAWVDEVLLKALSLDPAQRYADAAEMLQALQQAKLQSVEESQLPATLPKKPFAAQVAAEPTEEQESQSDSRENKKGSKPPLSNKALLRIGVVVVGFFVALIVTLFYVIRNGSEQVEVAEQPDGLVEHRAATNDVRMKLAIDGLSDEAKTEQKRVESLAELIASEDPLAHEVLIASAINAKSETERSASETAIADRCKRLGFGRTAEQSRLWLRTVEFPSLPERYESVLRATNPFLNLEQTEPILKNLYSQEAGLALRLLVARALDSKAPEQYEPLLRQFVADQRGLSDPAVGTWATLVLEEMDLAVVYGEEALPALPTADGESLKQLLLTLASRNDSLLQPVAKILAGKNSLPSADQKILTSLIAREDLPVATQSALARMALHDATEQDFLVFSQWVDPDSEQILYALASAGNNSTAALDLLSGRAVGDKKMAAVIERIRSTYWDKRQGVAQAIGILALRADMDNNAIQTAVQSFKPFADDRKMVNALLALGDERVLQSAIEAFPGKVGFGALLKLLESKESRVRITAVHSLKSFNDVSALKVIFGYYDKEKDEKVRQAYRDTFWNIADK